MKSAVLTLTLAALTFTATESVAGRWDKVTVNTYDKHFINRMPKIKTTELYLPDCWPDELAQINKGNVVARYKDGQAYIVRKAFLGENSTSFIYYQQPNGSWQSFSLNGKCKIGGSQTSWGGSHCICPVTTNAADQNFGNNEGDPNHRSW